ncbi:hypothetical protein, partial [Inquilinus limosus]
ALSAAPALAAGTAPNGVSLELNTLEPRGQNCAVNMVFGTGDDAAAAALLRRLAPSYAELLPALG